MADSLRLKGARSVSNHTGSEMVLRRPARGGDVFKVPTWWNLKHRVQYASAAVFKVSSTRGDLSLVIPIDPETQISPSSTMVLVVLRSRKPWC